MGTPSYSPLNVERRDIRVLTLEPLDASRSPLAPLVCSVTNVSLLDTKIAYETISYCWGQDLTRTALQLDGKLVTVPRSAEQALRRVSFSDRRRVVWIDAICIDQSAIVERSSQVGLMAQIYSRSTANLVYLGEDDEIVPSVLRDMDALWHGEIHDAVREHTTLLNLVYDQDQHYNPSSTGLKTCVDAEGLLAFYSIPWFSRLWVVQEAALAPSNICYCGAHEFDLTLVLAVASWLSFKCTFIDADLARCLGRMNASEMYEYRERAQGKASQARDQSMQLVDRLLVLARDTHCTDPRDKVFALLGLAGYLKPEDIPRPLAPDYDQTVAETFAKASLFAVEQARHLDMLLQVSHRSEEDMNVDDFPSWHPRWQRQFDYAYDAMNFSPCYNAAAGLDFKLSILDPLASSPSLDLVCHGFICDTIATIEFCPGSFSWKDFHKTHVAPLQRVHQHSEESSDGIADDVCRTLTGGIWYDFKPVTDEQIRACKKFLAALSTGVGLPPLMGEVPEDAPPEVKLMSESNQSVANMCEWRSAAVTEQRRTALVPYMAREGDVVAVISGCKYPCILRHVDEQQQQQQRYVFVGTAYVSNIMEGEAVRQWQLASKDLQILTIV